MVTINIDDEIEAYIFEEQFRILFGKYPDEAIADAIWDALNEHLNTTPNHTNQV